MTVCSDERITNTVHPLTTIKRVTASAQARTRVSMNDKLLVVHSK